MLKLTQYCLVGLVALSSSQSSAETLQQAWQAALTVDHSLKAAQQNTQASQLQLASVKAARLPSISISSGYTVLDDTPALQVPFAGNLVQFPMARRESLSYQAMTVLPLYTSGQISSSIKAAGAALEATKEVESGKALDIKLQVAETYLAVLRSAKSLEVVNSHVSSLIAHASDVTNMHEQGMVSRNDLLAAQVALADARQLAIKVENRLDISRAAFNRLVGRPLQQTVALDELEPIAFEQSLEQLTSQALAKRYELSALMQQANALSAQAKAVRAKNGPQVALRGGYNFNENDYQVHEGQWLVNVGVQWRLFDAGSTRNKASAIERQAMALKQQYEHAKSQISLQVRQYWLETQETGKRIQVTQASIGQAEENLRVNRDRYENGLSTNTEVLDAETLRTRSLDNHANAIYDAVLASIRLKRAVSEL